mgnify:CR=1 FL=1
MTTNQEIILSASNVEVQFTVRGKQLRAIRNISIDLYKDETLAIVGESGSGKSVFTKTFTGMLESNGKVTNGTAMFEGKDLYANKTDADWEAIRGKKIATIFQDPMTSLFQLESRLQKLLKSIRVNLLRKQKKKLSN